MAERVWILNHYAGHMPFEKGGRHYAFTRFLRQDGWEPVVFTSNAQHGNGERFYDTDALWHVHEAEEIGVPFVYVRSNTYRSNGLRRIWCMFVFCRNVQRAARQYASENGKPDVIMASSVHPLTLLAGQRLAKRYAVRCVCEIRDLWPESFVVYGIVKKGNPLLGLLYRGERRLYAKADALIFTMEGGRDYILEKGWDKAHGGTVDTEKIFHINNGVDLAQFDENREKRVLDDPELDAQGVFKVVYAGSMRQVNDISALLGAAELLREKRPDIRFLLYGDGDMRPTYEKRCAEKRLDNVSFRGMVEKEQVPSVLSRADVCFVDGCEDEAISRFGMSPNKLFEYLASGRPIIFPIQGRYDLVGTKGCGYTTDNTPAAVAEAIESLADDAPARETMGAAARKTAEDYDFKALTKRLEAIFEKVEQL